MKGIDSMLRRAWAHVVEGMPDGDRLQLQTYEGRTAMLGADDGWWVTAAMCRDGRPRKFAKIWIPVHPGVTRSEGALADHVWHHMRLLASMLCPSRPPKGWRLFGRRPR